MVFLEWRLGVSAEWCELESLKCLFPPFALKSLWEAQGGLASDLSSSPAGGQGWPSLQPLTPLPEENKPQSQLKKAREAVLLGTGLRLAPHSLSSSQGQEVGMC